jgi:hypothetical protein
VPALRWNSRRCNHQVLPGEQHHVSVVWASAKCQSDRRTPVKDRYGAQRQHCSGASSLCVSARIMYRTHEHHMHTSTMHFRHITTKTLLPPQLHQPHPPHPRLRPPPCSLDQPSPSAGCAALGDPAGVPSRSEPWTQRRLRARGHESRWVHSQSKRNGIDFSHLISL